MLSGMLIPTVVSACLVLGYVIKMWIDDVDNKWIPTILAVFGAVSACLVRDCISLELIVGGAASGLVSTGLHQLFKTWLSGGKQE